MYHRLINSISRFIPLMPSDIDLLKSLFHFVAVKKDFTLVQVGEVSRKVYFVNSGYLRYYKVTDLGEEQTIHLFGSGEFATVFSSFSKGVKSSETLHSICHAELLSIEHLDLEKLYGSGEKWQVFGRKIMETLLLEKEQRIIDQLSLTAQERYVKLMETHPDFVQNIPIQYLASFIGIQPESLSRIRKQIFLTNVK